MSYQTRFIDAYLECAVWADLEEGETHTEWSQEALQQAHRDCNQFIAENTDDLQNGSAEQAGHDLWLTRNGHGAGFWDRPELWEDGSDERLTEAAHRLGECYFYVGDDGLTYLA